MRFFLFFEFLFYIFPARAPLLKCPGRLDFWWLPDLEIIGIQNRDSTFQSL